MKGKKNLEKAIVLGLLLSTSVYGTAWAENYTDADIITEEITVNKDNDVESTVTGDVKFELGKKRGLPIMEVI